MGSFLNWWFPRDWRTSIKWVKFHKIWVIFFDHLETLSIQSIFLIDSRNILNFKSFFADLLFLLLCKTFSELAIKKMPVTGFPHGFRQNFFSLSFFESHWTFLDRHYIFKSKESQNVVKVITLWTIWDYGFIIFRPFYVVMSTRFELKWKLINRWRVEKVCKGLELHFAHNICMIKQIVTRRLRVQYLWRFYWTEICARIKIHLSWVLILKKSKGY